MNGKTKALKNSKTLAKATGISGGRDGIRCRYCDNGIHMGGSTENSSTDPYEIFVPGEGGEAENRGVPCARGTQTGPF